MKQVKKIAIIGLRDRDAAEVKKRLKRTNPNMEVDVFECYGENRRAKTVKEGSYDSVFINLKFSTHSTSTELNKVCDNVINYYGGMSMLLNKIKEAV